MNASPETPAVRLEGVTKQFGKIQALRGIDGEIWPGRLTGLAGPDGSGKTTLLRIMAGLMNPTHGRITIAGRDSVRDNQSLAEVVGYMPQRFGLYEDLSVMENLRLYADLRGLDRDHQKRTDRLLEFTRLGPFSTRLAGKLSGGMKQKLGLACALMANPRVLLLDEPGVGVDPVSRQDLWRMVQALTGEGMAVIWATAYLDEAERCASVLLLDAGVVAFSGAPDDLTSRLGQRSFRLLNPRKERRRVLSQALDLPAVRDGVIQGSAVRVVLRQDAGSGSLTALALDAGAEIQAVAPRFEDAFVDLLGGGPGGSSALAESFAPVALDEKEMVSCTNLTKRFGAFTAADEVSFDVHKGEIFGLLGPNGAGKSTIFKMLCGLLKPTAGQARVTGLDLRTATSAAKTRLGYMAQKFSLYNLLSVKQNLEFSAGVYGLTGRLKRERIDAMVETLQLRPHLHRAPDQLSLGFKQRLALACALMHQPSVLFLDEPTSGVDPITRREFWTHINGLVRKGVTVLVTTHFMDEAEYCDRVALMYQAKLIALDTPDRLKAQLGREPGQEPTMEETFIHLVRKVETRDSDSEIREVAS